MRECMRLLQQFADGHLTLREFELTYWTERSRCLGDADPAHSRLDNAVHTFERDLSRYVPDPVPEIQQVEERELRRRALRALRAMDRAA